MKKSNVIHLLKEEPVVNVYEHKSIEEWAEMRRKEFWEDVRMFCAMCALGGMLWACIIWAFYVVLK